MATQPPGGVAPGLGGRSREPQAFGDNKEGRQISPLVASGHLAMVVSSRKTPAKMAVRRSHHAERAPTENDSTSVAVSPFFSSSSFAAAWWLGAVSVDFSRARLLLVATSASTPAWSLMMTSLPSRYQLAGAARQQRTGHLTEPAHTHESLHFRFLLIRSNPIPHWRQRWTRIGRPAAPVSSSRRCDGGTLNRWRRLPAFCRVESTARFAETINRRGILRHDDVVIVVGGTARVRPASQLVAALSARPTVERPST